MPNTIVQTHTHDNLLLSKKCYEKERPTTIKHPPAISPRVAIYLCFECSKFT